VLTFDVCSSTTSSVVQQVTAALALHHACAAYAGIICGASLVDSQLACCCFHNTEYLRRQEAEHSSLDCKYCGHGVQIYHWSEDKKYANDVATVDHVWLRSRGGGDDEGNLAVSCQPCNASKGDGDCAVM
jgi:hypothetical protein